MLQSQFNLDHRINELRQAGAEPRRFGGTRATRSDRSIGAAVRSLFGWDTASARRTSLTAH